MDDAIVPDAALEIENGALLVGDLNTLTMQPRLPNARNQVSSE
jgi:hypothetical protein